MPSKEIVSYKCRTRERKIEHISNLNTIHNDEDIRCYDLFRKMEHKNTIYKPTKQEYKQAMEETIAKHSYR